MISIPVIVDNEREINVNVFYMHGITLTSVTNDNNLRHSKAHWMQYLTKHLFMNIKRTPSMMQYTKHVLHSTESWMRPENLEPLFHIKNIRYSS